jgi:hypothetical protein
MTKVIITAEVEDAAKWEQGFRSHADLFREMTIQNSIELTTNDKNQVCLCAEPADLDKYLEILNAPVTAEAMGHDGVKKDTVKVFVLEKEMKL